MLKKLVKYGNSYALVLDRSILALLNIEEQSVVRLRIEGNTLLVKAEQEAKATDVLMLDIENMHNRSVGNTDVKNPTHSLIEENMRKVCKDMEKNPEAMEDLKKWAPGTENFNKLQQAYQKIMKKYQEDMKPLSSEQFQKDSQEIHNKHQGETSSEGLINEILALRLKYAPNLAKMDEEMRVARVQLGYPESLGLV